MGIISEFADVSATIYNPSGTYSDGRPVEASGIAVRVFPLGGETAVRDSFGNVRSGRVFQCVPCSPAPQVGGRLEVGGVSYTIFGVKPYRRLAGDIVGYRISAGG